MLMTNHFSPTQAQYVSTKISCELSITKHTSSVHIANFIYSHTTMYYLTYISTQKKCAEKDGTKSYLPMRSQTALKPFDYEHKCEKNKK